MAATAAGFEGNGDRGGEYSVGDEAAADWPFDCVARAELADDTETPEAADADDSELSISRATGRGLMEVVDALLEALPGRVAPSP